MEMTGRVTNLLAATLNDPEEPFTVELDKTAKGVTGCLSNVLRTSNNGSQSNDSFKVSSDLWLPHEVYSKKNKKETS